MFGGLSQLVLYGMCEAAGPKTLLKRIEKPATPTQKLYLYMEACEENNVNAVKRLLELGLDLNGEWPNKERGLLSVALTHSAPQITELILERGADPNEISNGQFVIFRGHYIKLLIKYGAFISTVKYGEHSLRSWLKVDYDDNTVNKKAKKAFKTLCKKLAKRRWVFVKCYMKLLYLHHRAVVTANHPLRKLARGEFNDGSPIQDVCILLAKQHQLCFPMRV